MRIFAFSSGSMEEDVSPCSALGGAGVDDGNVDEVLSATWLLGLFVDAVWYLEEGREDCGCAGTSAFALLRAAGLVRGMAGRLSSAPNGLPEACALRGNVQIRSDKLGSSEDPTI